MRIVDLSFTRKIFNNIYNNKLYYYIKDFEGGFEQQKIQLYSNELSFNLCERA